MSASIRLGGLKPVNDGGSGNCAKVSSSLRPIVCATNEFATAIPGWSVADAATTIEDDEELPRELGGDLGGLDGIVGFHIRLAHGAVYRHFTETFATLDLTQKQVSALWLVDDHPDVAQTGLAQRMRMDRATTMAIVNRLEAKGYLVRRKSRSDGRKQAL